MPGTKYVALIAELVRGRAAGGAGGVGGNTPGGGHLILLLHLVHHPSTNDLRAKSIPNPSDQRPPARSMLGIGSSRFELKGGRSPAHCWAGHRSLG